MSAYLQTDLWVVVQQSERPNAPRPLPLESGFTSGFRYKVLGLHCPSETSEAYFILCNDRDEVWFISNQHFRVADGEHYRQTADSRTNGHSKATLI
ncbi:MAG TPA: hypothetical protein VGL56_03500 [Fimbriimonadaceae bacterium]|jgi:hypothetical protein